VKVFIRDRKVKRKKLPESKLPVLHKPKTEIYSRESKFSDLFKKGVNAESKGTDETDSSINVELAYRFIVRYKLVL